VRGKSGTIISIFFANFSITSAAASAEVMTANRLTGASFNADPIIVMAGPKQRLCA
jgi:hypothetical protein